MPTRHQLSRKKGFRLPPGVVNVARLYRHRWVLTGSCIWQYESKPRVFHGAVFPLSDGTWGWNTGFGGKRSGECETRREAMNNVVSCRKHVLMEFANQ